ncbi:MAG: limonene-1,2-epoxide hydrolase [Alphaproteobacteria bacterium PA2]|nr:MAG: limonene-1,2-epoxide hydrolase [Alphaproteobacteria bacterium PA2]
MSENEATIRRFIDAWPRLDPDELVAFFTEDGIYHNMPIGPIQGQAALRPFIAAFLGNWTATNWDILNITAQGDLVMAERVDHITVGEKQIDLPCCGVFELRDGRIAAWRDYFDMGTYTRALAG